MSLSKKQQRFTQCIGLLIHYAYTKGYALTLGDAYRDPRVHGKEGEKVAYGAANSQHKRRMAIDLNLFVDGKYITDGNHPAYKDLGEYWKSLDGDCAWGGDFGDANHFSFEHNGFK